VLFCHVHGTTYRALSADATTAYGLSPVLAIHDELGQVVGPRSELYDAIETAMSAHAEPLSIVISTQAPSDADLLSTPIRDAETGADRRSGPSSTGCSASPPDRKEAGQSSPVASQHNRSLLKGALGGG
jgi:hypothetical protein